MVDFPKIKQHQKKSMLAVEALLSVIASRYAIGDKLPPERVLAQEMDISRNTLREAIAALQLMGILEVRHSQGNFVVALPKNEEKAFSLETIFIPNVDPFTMVDSRVGLEPGVAYLAAERATAKDVLRLKGCLERIAKAIGKGDRTGYAEADVQFHLGIAKSTQNEIIVHSISSLVDVLKKPLWQAMKEGLNQVEISRIRIQEHKAIFEAIQAGDKELAASRMREHLLSSKERFLHEIE